MLTRQFDIRWQCREYSIRRHYIEIFIYCLQGIARFLIAIVRAHRNLYFELIVCYVVHYNNTAILPNNNPLCLGGPSPSQVAFRLITRSFCNAFAWFTPRCFEVVSWAAIRDWCRLEDGNNRVIGELCSADWLLSKACGIWERSL